MWFIPSLPTLRSKIDLISLLTHSYSFLSTTHAPSSPILLSTPHHPHHSLLQGNHHHQAPSTLLVSPLDCDKQEAGLRSRRFATQSALQEPRIHPLLYESQGSRYTSPNKRPSINIPSSLHVGDSFLHKPTHSWGLSPIICWSRCTWRLRPNDFLRHKTTSATVSDRLNHIPHASSQKEVEVGSAIILHPHPHHHHHHPPALHEPHASLRHFLEAFEDPQSKWLARTLHSRSRTGPAVAAPSRERPASHHSNAPDRGYASGKEP